MEIKNQIEIYQAQDGSTQINVQFEEETVWLTQAQMAELFKKGRTTITEHINNIFKEGELTEDMVCRDFRHTTQHGAIKGKTQSKNVKYYNLDVIISVGYRVKSRQGTQFRIWATQTLKDHLVQGYTINQKRLEQKEQEVKLLKDGIHILTRTVSKAIEEKASDNIILETFAKGLSLLDDYDHEELDAKGLTTTEANYPSLDDYQAIINQMLTEFDSDVFGKEKDKSFQSSVAQIAKGFGDDDFYPSLEEKATMLLYFVVKNHSFVDGNKRIAAACFLKFLQQNNMLFNNQQQPIISNDTLASLTLFIASSKPEEMQTVTRLVISVLNRNNSN
ncbi:putative DNA-binding protein in cluster with Type I restriction-modification system [Winogradskyella psychrotolerans RS-3]|uniref:Putative DNA-binding protein in cluster with Type I restriction-modification system n=1 Tax=Winogradskyella psychrotolerans RS-3 TaxID=641526 RepID=S7VT73_9FLAO|nr:virulence protein RhuM/Fic/DOC family protein [Winogradskyella psychrotolerans]EPR72562.1 putative DNA-binding protein in cluster with Type I restriction-modification system [Winogradskyella psychrotolerans RS-3]